MIATGFRHYGPWRRVAVAVIVMAIAAVVTLVLSTVVFAKAMGGSITGVSMAIGLFGGPALCVLLLGLLATRVAGAEHPADREHHHVS